GTLRDLLGLGAKLQATTAATLLFEPMSRLLLGSVAGTAFLGLYEMAQRMIYQVRGIAVMGQRALLPSYVATLETAPHDLDALFDRTSRLSALSAVILLGGAVLLSPLVSLLWLGELNRTFVTICALLGIAWTFNVVVVPAIFLGEARGQIAANFWGAAIAAVLAPILILATSNSALGLFATAAIALSRMSADILPALLNRPAATLRSAVITKPDTYAALGAVAAFAWIASYQLTATGG
ncbi:MAG: oligosaccharide flippase family protein, partial [Pseudomonadota bacterium]